MGAAPPLELEVVARDHYQIEAELARGGMGRILQARDQRHGRPVAIKELLADTPALRARFRREALITARLQHPAIVPVYEAGRWPTGEPFYAMKLVDGRSLDRVIAECPTLEARLALLHNVIAVAEAIAFAHERQVIHRDLKPANVLVGGFGETVVIDWGLAKELGEVDPVQVPAGPTSEPPASSSTTVEVALSEVPAGLPAAMGGLTVAGRALGTPAYMAPEQARGETLDARADVYALGSILYHLLAGRMPYADSKATTGPDLLRHVVASPPTALLELEPKTPRDLAAIVDRAMARDPAQRYPNASQLAADLRRFETGQLVSVRAYSAADLFRRWLRRNRVVVAFAVLLVVLLAAGGAISVTRIVRERDRAREEQDKAQSANQRAALAEALRDEKVKEAQGKETAATVRAAAAETASAEAVERAAQSARDAQAVSAGLLAVWAETQAIHGVRACYLRGYVRGSTRLPTTLELVIGDQGKLTSAVLADSPAALGACVKGALAAEPLPPRVGPGTYGFPFDVDVQTGDPRVGLWVADADWHREVVRRRFSATMTRCYQQRVVDDALAEARTSVGIFVVQPTGRVQLTGNKITPEDAALAACIKDEVASWQLRGASTPIQIKLGEVPRPAPPAGSTVCRSGHGLFDEHGGLHPEWAIHTCTAYGRYDARDGKRNQLGWHSHDPALGNAR